MNKLTIISIDVVVMYLLDILPLVKIIIFHNGIIQKPAIIFQSILNTHKCLGEIHTVELQILILLVWVGGNLTKRFINNNI